ncbi:MAG: hypothetical protein UR66_C0001G0034 [Candidatus Moranbacteria bacterium GW2011_GWE1_35_17]|nr:MAG: hypothetical protein UR66_C0001G0034 [Candidatus Moranbacteria bacterium GW2011_GWE1_35_17]KKP71752.1 MAG: hypothetical protein UR65_C0027G0003 [Candidatus Moranbacteria bacterium GW2011_GWE2_35_164]KKP83377.1 MAG: hypothetical protein UR82_C0021G0007 [Candidatus Moranbacteria bacterium GW2011_GWF1_35_5]KKP84666.1 MAG: hypothetical protein UR83_C0016G0006 [Candidatus Moranbacteria bacterium GW2011_GWF2_35_54]
MSDKFLPKELVTEEWFKKAYDDELNAKSILKHKDGTPGGACFLAQQMAEKLFKAVLVFKEGRFPKIHNVVKLLKLIIKTDIDFKELEEEAVILNDFYITSRYPDDMQEFSWQDAEEAFDAAEKIKKFVFKKLKK